MQQRTAHELADKVRRQLTGIDGVMAVDAVHFNEHAPPDQGWAVRVARRPALGGHVTIIGSERAGYRTAEGTGPARNLPVLIRELFLQPVVRRAPNEQRPDDVALGAGIRAACSTLADVRTALGLLAEDVETRKEQLPWMVLGLLPGDNVTSRDTPTLYGPYGNEEAAWAAARTISARDTDRTFIALQARAEET